MLRVEHPASARAACLARARAAEPLELAQDAAEAGVLQLEPCVVGLEAGRVLRGRAGRAIVLHVGRVRVAQAGERLAVRRRLAL